LNEAGSTTGARSAALNEAVDRLLALYPQDTPNLDLVRSIVSRCAELPEQDLDRGELKILSSSLKDFVNSFVAFSGHRMRRKISIFGSARTPPGTPVYEHCRRFAQRCVEEGYMVITGAGPGIMRAGNEGATREHSFGVNISLPFEARSNDFIHGDPKDIDFKYFFTRKLNFVKESDAIVLFPGGFGTMDEGYEALTLLQTGKCDPLPVVCVDVPGSNYWPSWERYIRENLIEKGLASAYDRNLFRVTSDIDTAIDEIKFFYSTYHSLRYVGDTVILRLRREPSPRLLELLNSRYRDLLADGDYEQLQEPHPAERKESAEVQALSRIAFKFVHRKFGRLRRLIDEINMTAEGRARRDTGPLPTGHLPNPAKD